MKIEELLIQGTKILKSHDEKNAENGGTFNIFNILGIDCHEVMICRLMGEILSPYGSHCQGDIYLKLFFEYVLKKPEVLSNGKVYIEYLIEGNRRIDLVIEGKELFIPIEVKIYAEDLENQCYDYHKKAKNSPVYYLTIDGKVPDEKSIKDLILGKDVCTLSFSKDILYWLDKCLIVTIDMPSIKEILLQFKKAIENFAIGVEDEVMNEVKEMLLSSPENMKSAINIQNAIEPAKKAFKLKMFKAIEENVGQKKLDNDSDYNKSPGRFPGISYLYKEKVKEQLDLYVRIETDGTFLYIGYCYSKQLPTKDYMSLDQIKMIIGNKQPIENDDWWAYRETVKIENNEPNFKILNDEYYSLYDSNNFKKFVENCAKMINELLNF